MIGLDADTGSITTYHQYHWNGTWDWDEVSAPLLIDIVRAGRKIKGLIHAGRNGYLWVLERTPEGINFVDATPYVRQNVFISLDSKSGRPEYDPEKVPKTGKRVEFCWQKLN